MAKKLATAETPEVSAELPQGQTVEAPASAPVKPAQRWRVKHPMLGAHVVEAETADEAKEKVLRDKFPLESQDPAWLSGMKQMSMRVIPLS